jgi:serine/threonine protein kinase
MTTVFRDVGAYRIVREIGHGGMATVFLADDARYDRQVALKLVSMASDREGREVLDAERWGARLQRRLADACGLVPRVYEDGDQPPYYFIAMEYIHGENLSDLIARGPVPPDEAVRIALELSRFLDVAHTFRTAIDDREFWSLVHGDLKPRNVRLAGSGDVKVLDFGIAKALSLSRKVTRNDFGSMPYLSPERLDATEVDAAADLWALGVILYEMLHGGPPFHAADTRRLEQEIRAGYARRPLPDACPRGLQAIVSRLLAADPSLRYTAASQVHDDLQVFQQGQPTVAESAGFPGCLDEATRRTVPFENGDPEKTRRTLQPAPSSSSSQAAAPVSAPAPRTFRAHPIRSLLMLAVLFLACNEAVVGFTAGRVAAAAVTRDLDSLDDVWSEYAALSRRSYLRIGIVRLERVMTSRVQALSDQVIANYRTALPTVRERQWQIAQKNLQQALVLAPANRALKAELRYCEGHLHRIAGDTENARRRPAAARQQFAEAVTAFREAAELRRDWPDPFLGLARVFVYGLEDIDRAADAIRQAQKLGYTPGDRETAQLADGYRARGDSLWRTARQLAGMPQEPEYLQRASDAYKQARDLYERIPAFPGVAVNLRRAIRALDQIAGRVAERSAEAEEPWR